MKKTNILWIMMDLIFLIVFNTIYYMVGVSRYESAAWISYGFIHFSYLMMLFTPILTRKTKNTAILGFPIVSISSTFFLIEFIVGVILILINPVGFKLPLVIQMIITAIYLVLLLSHLIANEHTADSIERHEVELKYVKESSARLKSIIDSISDRNLRKNVEKAYDVIHASQVRSNLSVRNIELEVINLIGVLRNQVSSNPEQAVVTTNKIIQLAEERNIQLKLSN